MAQSMPRQQNEGTPSAPAPAQRTAWVIGLDDRLAKRVRTCLEGEGFTACLIHPGPQATAAQWLEQYPEPGVVVLDVGANVDWGVGIIEGVRRLRIGAPLIVMTRDFSREFGAKILSAGVRYYFPHDFSATEFLEVVRNLERRGRSSGQEGPPGPSKGEERPPASGRG